jgi:SAM-dependent MidA family methyltransferase
VPWQQAAHDWVVDVRRRLVAGSLIVVDYVTPRTAQLAAEPWRNWLRTYRGHERGAHYLRDVGEQDITTQVALDQLPEPDELRTQAQFLQRWGIDDLVEEGREAWAAAAARPTVAALAMRSRVREAEALLEPTGLGGFLSLVYRGRPDED